MEIDQIRQPVAAILLALLLFVVSFVVPTDYSAVLRYVAFFPLVLGVVALIWHLGKRR
jgi:glucose-6-phosphate-specific signal transduction histidine kinase